MLRLCILPTLHQTLFVRLFRLRFFVHSLRTPPLLHSTPWLSPIFPFVLALLSCALDTTSRIVLLAQQSHEPFNSQHPTAHLASPRMGCIGETPPQHPKELTARLANKSRPRDELCLQRSPMREKSGLTRRLLILVATPLFFYFVTYTAPLTNKAINCL